MVAKGYESFIDRCARRQRPWWGFIKRDICVWCGNRISRKSKSRKWRASREHLIPKSMGSAAHRGDWTNIVSAHAQCNSSRGTRSVLMELWRRHHADVERDRKRAVHHRPDGRSGA